MGTKSRLDVLLVERGLAESRERAQGIIRAGLVHSPDRILDKPGAMVDAELPITVRGPEHPYVSRGGIKLAGALDAFRIDPAGRVAIDLGASTGGFTDALLQRGAGRVYAIDVGRGQLHPRLASDPRVVSRERTHLDGIAAGDFQPRPSLAVADLSFISVTRALAPLVRVLTRPGEAVLLVKPQFELGRRLVPRGGVVRDASLHAMAVESVRSASLQAGFVVLGEAPSPIEGGDGNREFFLHLRLGGQLHADCGRAAGAEP